MGVTLSSIFIAFLWLIIAAFLVLHVKIVFIKVNAAFDVLLGLNQLEINKRPAPAESLTHDELALYERLDAQRLRLEQERLPLALVNRAFALALNVNDSDEGDKR